VTTPDHKAPLHPLLQTQVLKLGLNKVYSYQLFFNLIRPISLKENKTSFQTAQEKNPNLSQETPKIPPIFLDKLLAPK
jgi:hypothetical protein